MSSLTARGKRKSARAHARVVPASGKMNLNGKPFAQDCVIHQKLLSLLSSLGVVDQLSLHIRVAGGGKRGRVDAAVLATAKALRHYFVDQGDTEKAVWLRKNGYVTTDARCVERKKVGLRGARRRPQFSKR